MSYSELKHAILTGSYAKKKFLKLFLKNYIFKFIKLTFF